MKRNVLFSAIALVALGSFASGEALAKQAKPKSGHKFTGSVEIQHRSNDNVSLAPAAGDGFDYAELSEFGIEDEDDIDSEDEDEDEDEDDEGDGFDDLVDVDPSEDEIDEEDAIDEDGDGIDDLIDPNADNVVDPERRLSASVGLRHKYTFANGTTSWSNGIRFASDTHNQRNDLDKFNWAVTTGFGFSPKGSKHGFKQSLSYVALEQDSNEVRTTFVVSLGYTYEVSKRLELRATYNYQDKDISKPTSPDARVDTLALGADFKATDDDIFKLTYAPKVEDSTEVTRNSDAWGWEFTYTRRLPWDMTAGVGYSFDSVDFKNLVPNRKDDSKTWGVQLAKDIGKQFSLELGYETRDRQSNIPSKNAGNDSVYFGGAWKF